MTAWANIHRRGGGRYRQCGGKVRYASLFSGIEAASVAVAPLGWQPAWFAEVDPFCCAVLAHHYPDVPNLGDVSSITPAMLAAHGPVDVVIAGFPCQDLSVAGLRGGLAGARSGLFFELVRICHELRPTLILWENVPGLLSSNRGRDFGAVLMAMDRLGFDGAWTSLDAQYFGLAQRRQRVFGVFARRDIGAARCAEILAFTTRMHGHTPPRREAGQEVAGTIGGSSQSGGFRTTDLDNNGAYIPMLSPALTSNPYGDHESREGLLVPTHAHSENAHEGRNEPTSETLVPYTFDWQAGSSGDTSWQGKARSWIVDKPGRTRALTANRTLALAAPLAAGNGHTSMSDGIPNVVPAGMAVRRLTPTECLRLQGFPDDYLDVLYRGKPAADGPKYKAIGNSMAVPCMRWICERIDATIKTEY